MKTIRAWTFYVSTHDFYLPPPTFIYCFTFDYVWVFCCYFSFDFLISDNRRFQATNPQTPGDQQQQQSRPPVQNGKAQQHSNGVLLKPSQKDLESKYFGYSFGTHFCKFVGEVFTLIHTRVKKRIQSHAFYPHFSFYL